MSLEKLARLCRGGSRQLTSSLQSTPQWLAAASQQRHVHGSSPAPQATATDPADVVLRKAFAHCVRNVRRALIALTASALVLAVGAGQHPCAWGFWHP